jgi:hypothetical protein
LGDLPGIPLGEMAAPTADRVLYLCGRSFPTSVFSIEAFEVLVRSSYIAVAKANTVWVDAKSEEVRAVVSFGELAFDGVDL